MPGTYNIPDAYANDTFQRTFIITDSLDAPINLSGATIKMEVRKKSGDPVLFTASTGGDGITIGGVGNNEITVSKDLTVVAGSYRYDLQSIKSGVTKTYVAGEFIVTADIVQ